MKAGKKHHISSVGNSQAVVGTGGRTWPQKAKRFLSSRYIFLFVTYICIVAAIVAGVSIVAMRNRHHANKLNQQQHEILTSAEPLLIALDSVKLKPIVDKIKQQPNYEGNINYLYILVTYYIGISDSKNARLYFDKLTSAYTSDFDYDEAIRSKVIPIDNVKSMVEYLEDQSTKTGPGLTFGIEQ